MSLSRYPEYKPSGIEWLPEVPSHWIVKRVRHAAYLNPSKRETQHLPRDLQVDFLPMEAVGTDGRISREQKKPLEAVIDGFTYFREGDVALAKITPCFENGKCAVMRDLSEGIGFGTTELTVLRPKPDQAVSEYLFYLLSSEPFRVLGESEMYGAGGQKRVPDKFVRNFRIPFPPVPEQEKIADFLDHETARIDALIEEQQRLIELLQEKRQAVISHAVTKGLNPDAPMKDSGVEWLGGVPEHWYVMPAKWLFEFVTSGSRGWAQYYSEYGDLFFRIANLNRQSIHPNLGNRQFVSAPESSEADRSRIRRGDLLISITADLGSVCAAGSELEGGYVSQHVALARPNSKVAASKWLAYFVSSSCAQEQLMGAGYGGTKIQLSLDDIKELQVAVPPHDEQKGIERFLREQVAQFEELTEHAEKMQLILKERRSALISAAVTGEIDVRNWQPEADVADELPMAAEEAASYEAREQ